MLVTKPKLLSLSAFLRCPVVISGLGRRGSNRGRSTEKSHRDFDPLESGRLPDLSIDPRPTADHCVTLNTLLTFSEPQVLLWKFRMRTVLCSIKLTQKLK